MPIDTRLPICPRCKSQGHSVKPKTLDVLLTPTVRSRLESTGGWSFCDTPSCNVVYFPSTSETHKQLDTVLEKDALVVPVGVKRTSAPRPLCYCFDHSVESLQTDPERALIQIKSLMKSDGCRCVTTNPQGRCCLPTVEAAIETIQAERRP